MGFDFFVLFFKARKHSREPHKTLYISEKGASRITQKFTRISRSERA